VLFTSISKKTVSLQSEFTFMKIQYASDIHLEFPENIRFLKDNPIIPKADILVLAGDIIPFAIQEMADWFFDYLSDNFLQTYWIAGNHEFYRSNILTGNFNKSIRENVHLVNNFTAKHEDINLIFSTLWTKIREENMLRVQTRMNDYHLIYDKDKTLHPRRTNELFDENIAFITSELERLQNEKTVVVTHHVPTLKDFPMNSSRGRLFVAYATELSEMIENLKPNAWIYGHSHHSKPKIQIGETTLLNNSLGYVAFEKTEYQNGRTIQV